MKKLLLRFLALALSALLAAPLFAQSAASEKPNPAPRETQLKTEAYWSRQESPELIEAHSELEHMQQKYADKHPAIIEQRQKIETLEKMAPWVFNIEFPGGTLKQLLAKLAGPEGMSFNMIGSGDPADFATLLPPFSLHNAKLISVAKVLDSLLGPRGFGLRVID